MNLSLIGKMKTIFQYIFSSFLSIEMFIMSLLLFLILIVNLKRNNKIIQLVAIGIYIGFVVGLFISYNSYVKTCIKSFSKAIMNYIYFPSTIAYFFIIIFVTVLILRTVFSKKLSYCKKVINYSFFSILYFFFMSTTSLAAYHGIDLLDTATLYENDIILSLIQISNLLLLLWSVYTGFYWLYKYFKDKYDKE